MHLQLVQTPLPSVLLLCHCQQPSQHPAPSLCIIRTKQITGTGMHTRLKHMHVGCTCTQFVAVTKMSRTPLIRDLHQPCDEDYPGISLSLLSVSVILFHSFTLWSLYTHTHRHIHHTPTHITLTRAHSIPSLPLYVSRRAHHNGCRSPESFSATTCLALSLTITQLP